MADQAAAAACRPQHPREGVGHDALHGRHESDGSCRGHRDGRNPDGVAGVGGPQTVAFGQSAEIPSANGAEAINYTVNNLQPSGHNDGIWYSDVTATGVRGNATPVIADFNARAVNSSTYAVMKGHEVDGLPNQPIAPGAQATGRLYFDVRGGTAPDSVVYRDAAGVDKVV